MVSLRSRREMDYDPAPVIRADYAEDFIMAVFPHAQLNATLTLFWRRPGMFAGTKFVGDRGTRKWGGGLTTTKTKQP